MRAVAVLAALLVLSVPAAHGAAHAAGPETFKFKLNFFASDTGYYEVEGYEGVQPELTMKVGETYVFDQTDETNWMHPLGFAYYPDGAHDNKDEVEEDSLVYLIDGVQPAENLDGYEPEFFYPREAWKEKKYTVELTITPEIVALAKGGKIFYFCHIHSGMSGYINLVNSDGSPVATTTAPVELYKPYQAGAFDAKCGTYEAAPFASDASPNLCPDQTYLCDHDVSDFGKCMHAIDCKMNYEMRVGVTTDTDPTATFMHQMIPHHENAVNMAKVLMKFDPKRVAEDEEVADLLYDIINTQNAQITFMRGWLRDNGFATYEDARCDDKAVGTTRRAGASGATSAAVSSSQLSFLALLLVAFFAVM